MSDKTRAAASSMQEFFTLLADAIREGKSDAQVLKRFIVNCITTRVLVPVYRTRDGKFSLEDRKTPIAENASPIEVPMDEKDTVQGWTESGEVYMATLEAYEDLKLTYGEENVTKDAMREVCSIIKKASALAAKELDIKGRKSLDPISMKLDFALESKDIFARLVGAYAKDGDFTKLDEVQRLLAEASAAAAATRIDKAA